MAVSVRPVADRAAASALGDALRKVGYSEDAIVDLLGEEAFETDMEDAPVHERRLPDSPLATVIRAFFLELPVAADEAVRALGTAGLEALEATGLAEVGEEVVARARIVPIGDLLLASDSLSSDPRADPPDYVGPYSPTSALCDKLTPRPRIARALDVGAGNGAHALLAAAHSDHVVATDVNERALAYTELNAALNGLDNVECRRGSLFEPAENETFDLITCNAPFVISPDRRWTYRDAGFRGDELSERVVRLAAEHLADGGFATLLVSWLATDDDAPDEHPLAWVEGSGCDAWILSGDEADPLDHAATWSPHLADDPDAFAAALDEWTRYFHELGATSVIEGAVLLHRRPGGRHTVRVDSIDKDAVDVADEQIRLAFENRARLAELARPEELLAARLELAMPVSVETDFEPRQGGPAVAETRVSVGEGIEFTLDTSAGAAGIVPSLDGRQTLADAVGADDRVRGEALTLCHELLELGALRLHAR